MDTVKYSLYLERKDDWIGYKICRDCGARLDLDESCDCDLEDRLVNSDMRMILKYSHE